MTRCPGAGDGHNCPVIPSISLTRLRSNIGDELAIPAAGITCIVGANNVGKSQLLRDVIALVRGHVKVPTRGQRKSPPR